MDPIADSAVISCEGHRCDVALREVPVCPSTPCSLVNSLETAVWVDFPTADDEGHRRQCNGRSVNHGDQKPPRVQSFLESDMHHCLGNNSKVSGIDGHEVIIGSDSLMINETKKGHVQMMT